MMRLSYQNEIRGDNRPNDAKGGRGEKHLSKEMEMKKL
jgi:hypothetical protein